MGILETRPWLVPLGLVAMGLAGALIPPAAPQRSAALTITNAGSNAILMVMVRPVGKPGQLVGAAGSIESGGTESVTLNGVEGCHQDVTIRYVDGSNLSIWGVDLCSQPKIEIDGNTFRYV